MDLGLITAVGYTVAFAAGAGVALLWASWQGVTRIVDVPRVVDVPTPLGTCVACGERLRLGPPYQLYLELNDVHGRQRGKWTVGRGERAVQSVQADDAIGVARVNKEVWAAVIRCNTIDQGETAHA